MSTKFPMDIYVTSDGGAVSISGVNMSANICEMLIRDEHLPWPDTKTLVRMLRKREQIEQTLVKKVIVDALPQPIAEALMEFYP
jgi:hypothetical protein